MNKRITCSFCNNHTYNDQYYCCDENEISCFGCKEFGCHVCRQRFVKRMEECWNCINMFRREHLFGDGFYKFCVSCCRKDFNEGRKFGINKFGLAKDRFEIYEFLKKFCTHCNKLLSRTFEANETKLKEIFALDNNLCCSCEVEPKMRCYKSPGRNIKKSIFESSLKRSMEFMNDSIFNRDKPKCMKCDVLILGCYKYIDGNKVCNFCFKHPNQELSTPADSRMKLRSMYSGNELEDTNETESSFYSSKYQKEKKTDQQDSKLTKWANSEQEISNKTNIKESNNQPIIEDEVEEKCFNKVKRSESWNEDIIMEPVTDHEIRKKLSKMSSNISESYENQDNRYHEEISSKVKREEDFMMDENDQDNKIIHTNEQENDEIEQRVPTFGPENEPIIVEEQNQKSKVKRFEEWNDEIILEPIEDYEKRKREKDSEIGRSKVCERNENLETPPTLRCNYESGTSEPMTERKETTKNQSYESYKNKEEQKFKLNEGLKNERKVEDTKYEETMNPNDSESKYSFTSDQLKESRISTKSSNKKSQASKIDEQNYDRRLRSSQMFNKDKTEQVTSTYKRTETVRPQVSDYYDSRIYQHNVNSRQFEPASTYHQTYYDKNKPFPFPSTTTTRNFNDGTGRYVPPSQKTYNYENIKTTAYRSPEKETNYYEKFSNRQPESIYSSPKQNYQETKTSRTTTSNVRESRTQEEPKNEKNSNFTQSRIMKVCFRCKNKIIDSSRTFTLNSEAICMGCWDNYDKKKFGNESEMRRSGYYSKHNYF